MTHRSLEQSKLKNIQILSFLSDMRAMIMLKNTETINLNNLTFQNPLEWAEYIKIQELGFLPEYYLISILFGLTLFFLFSIELKKTPDNLHFSIRFEYNNQVIFLLLFSLICYLTLILQQINLSKLSLISFNDTISNDELSVIAKLIIGLSSLFYLIFISKYLKHQKLSNFEYYILSLTSLFGFFLLCSANDLVTAYLAIELQGLSFYVLASFKKSSNFSIESGVKYFVLGSLSTAIFLLGTTFIYGLSGSVLLTDFKDFFVWIFSVNSFFLSFDSIFRALEIFQEKTALREDSASLIELKTILNKIDLFKKKFYLLPADLLALQLHDTIESLNSNEINLYNNISEKLTGLSENTDDFSYFYYVDHNYFYLFSDDFQDYVTETLVTRDALVEKVSKNMFSWMLFTLQDNNLFESENILGEDLKNKCVESNYYEPTLLDEFFALLLIKFSNCELNDTFFSSQAFSEFLYFFKCFYFSNCQEFNSELLTIMSLVDNFDINYCIDFEIKRDIYQYIIEYFNLFFSTLNMEDSQNDILFNAISVSRQISIETMLFNETFSSLLSKEFLKDNIFFVYNDCTQDLLTDYIKVLNHDIFLNFESINNRDSLVFQDSNLPVYLFSLINILNLSSLFLELNNTNSFEYYFMFNYSFVILGFLILILAIFFKLALAPFHLWSPDVYEGSPSSSTFFFMTISKFSLFVFLLRLCYISFYSFITCWQFYSLSIATISIFIGAIAGLKQRRLKSLLTYSSINNMGFVLLALSTGSLEGIQTQFYYLVIYMISGLSIWAIILNLKLKKKVYSNKQNRDLGDFALLQESNSVAAQNLIIVLFTLAGLPPMVGFLAKMSVFKALTGVSFYFFSLINILFSVIATFYYIRIIKIIFFENVLIGKLYGTINETKKVFVLNLLVFSLIFLFISPMLLYFYSYKMTLLLNKSFY